LVIAVIDRSRAEALYNNKYIKLLQIVTPVAIRLGTNYCGGQALYSDMEIPVLLGAMSCTQLSGKADALHMLLLNPIKHQLMSWLIYGALSSIGLNKDVTIFASKMCATLLYSSRFSDRAQEHFDLYTVIPDLSTCILSSTGLYYILGKSYFMPYAVSIAFRSLFDTLAVEALDPKLDKEVPSVLAWGLYASIYDAILPIGVHSPLISCLDDSMKFFVDGITSFVAESGIASHIAI
jgi:hypothetical protein